MTLPPSGRKILVLVNGDLSTRAAVAWAAHWAKRTGDSIVLFHVIEPDHAMGFGVMQDLMRAEQWQATERMMATFSSYAEKLTGHPPAHLVREGMLRDTVREVLKTEPNLSMLVIAASHREAGPAPLIGYLASRMGSRVQVPMVLVPGSMTAEEIEKMV